MSDCSATAMTRRTLFQIMEQRWFLPTCVLLAGALRASILLVEPLEQTSDFGWYHARAVGIALGQGYNQDGVLTAFWPVGWPGALAGIFTVTGDSVLAGQVANLLMAVVACLMTAVLGGALFNDRTIGRLAALLIAIYPNQIAYVPLLSTEIFYELLLLFSIYLLTRERLVSTGLAGLLFGIATLTKTQSLAVPGFLFLWVFLAGPSWAAIRRFTLLCGVTYVMLVLVVAPWTYRNWTVFHEIIPVSTNGGWTLLTGNSPEANGDYVPETILAEGITHDPADQVSMDALARDRALTWIMSNPGRFVSLLPRKFLGLWLGDGEAEWFYQRGFAGYERNATLFRAVRVLNQGYYFLLLALAIPTILLLMRRRLPGVLPWAHTGIALFVFFSLLSLVFSGQSRFHFSLMPFVAIYAACTIKRACVGRVALVAEVQPGRRGGRA